MKWCHRVPQRFQEQANALERANLPLTLSKESTLISQTKCIFINVVEYFESEAKKSKSHPNIIDKIEDSATYLKSCTGYHKSCEFFESQLILKSEIIIINLL